MNKDETKAAIAVMQAWLDGAEIQLASQPRGLWADVHVPGWDWSNCKYRIKPREPRKLLLGRDRDHQNWQEIDSGDAGFWNQVIRVREVIDD